MNELGDHHTKWSKSDKDKYDIGYKWNLKNNDANEFIYRTQTQALRKGSYGYKEGGMGGGRLDWEFHIDMYTLLYLK